MVLIICTRNRKETNIRLHKLSIYFSCWSLLSNVNTVNSSQIENPITLGTPIHDYREAPSLEIIK